MKKINLNIKGMHCESCKKIIEMELKDKVNSINIDLRSNKADIEFDEKKISLQKIKDIIKELGYQA